MKKVLIMATVTLFTRLLAADQVDIKSLVGKDWYGIYMNGQKAGFSVNSIDLEPDGKVKVIEDATFRIQMMGNRQDMRIYQERQYAADGSLISINESVDDIGGKKEFHAKMDGDEMVIVSTVTGKEQETRIPKPKESVKDAVKQVELVKDHPAVGKQIAFTMVEPMFNKELAGTSKIVAVETRVLEGAQTKVYRVESTMEPGITSNTYVAENGKVLEDQFAGMLVMRLEPKEIAQDVSYSNDVIVSNAIMPDKKIEEPRTCESLHLLITGPLGDNQMFNDDRQSMKKTDGGVDFVGKPSSVESLKAAQVPITAADVKQWKQPSMLVQSDDPRLIAKAKEIVGDEKDAVAISNKLCEWVYRNVRTIYSARLSNSLEVLEDPEGDCTEHSMLFIGLARAAGLPAREAAGLIYVDDAKPGFYFHQWASVWVGRWIDVDPTFDQPLADATHIKLAAGDLYEQAKLIPVIGKLQIKVLDK